MRPDEFTERVHDGGHVPAGQAGVLCDGADNLGFRKGGLVDLVHQGIMGSVESARVVQRWIITPA